MRSHSIIAFIALLPYGSLLGAADLPRSQEAQRRQMLAGFERLPTDRRIASLTKWTQSNPADAEMRIALAKAFLQKLRETGDGSYLTRASAQVDRIQASDRRSRAAQRLENEIAMNMHQFPKVADSARTMLEDHSSDATTWGLLGDALMELGRYEQAGDAYQHMASLGGNLFSYNRLAYHSFVTGHPEAALAWMNQAIQAGSHSQENEAWCLTEMGDMLFKTGKVADADYAYKRALQIFPGYHRAYAGQGRIEAAAGRMAEAIKAFERAAAVVPLAEYAGALESLYEVAGDNKNATRELAMIAVADRLMTVNGEKANRSLALIYADTGTHLARALELAKAEFEVRHDVYSFDALSWVLYRNGQVSEAKEASEKALALHTPEPNFYFHAGMIAMDSNSATATKYLEKALNLNANFDIRHAPLARSTLLKLRSQDSAARLREEY